MIRYQHGNLLDSQAQTLVNTVNCVGIMGKGVALEFRRRFPKMYKDYLRMCEDGLVRPGEPYCYSGSGHQIINFPTKDHWRSRSRLADIDRGLSILRTHYVDWNITSLALPPLGCGNGGLNWSEVRPLIEHYLGELPIDVEVYVPLGSDTDTAVRAADVEQESFAFVEHPRSL